MNIAIERGSRGRHSLQLTRKSKQRSATMKQCASTVGRRRQSTFRESDDSPASPDLVASNSSFLSAHGAASCCGARPAGGDQGRLWAVQAPGARRFEQKPRGNNRNNYIGNELFFLPHPIWALLRRAFSSSGSIAAASLAERTGTCPAPARPPARAPDSRSGRLRPPLSRAAPQTGPTDIIVAPSDALCASSITSTNLDGSRT